MVLLCVGVGYVFRFSLEEFKGIDEWLEQRKKEDDHIVGIFKKEVEEIKKELDNKISLNALNNHKKNIGAKK